MNMKWRARAKGVCTAKCGFIPETPTERRNRRARLILCCRTERLNNHELMMNETMPLVISQPDYRIHEMNKRLQQRTEESDNLWWDAFATEFFEDDAQIILTFCLEDGPKRYCERKSWHWPPHCWLCL